MKNVQMDLDRMDKAMLAEIAARSRQLGVTTGIQCRANEQRKPDDIRHNERCTCRLAIGGKEERPRDLETSR